MSDLEEKAKGKYNEAMGDLTNDQSQQAKGHAQEAKADAENKAKDAKQTVNSNT